MQTKKAQADISGIRKACVEAVCLSNTYPSTTKGDTLPLPLDITFYIIPCPAPITHSTEKIICIAPLYYNASWWYLKLIEE